MFYNTLKQKTIDKGLERTRSSVGLLKDIQTPNGIRECIICTKCFGIISLSLLDKISKGINEFSEKTTKIELDPTTKFARGSEEYNNYYYPKTNKDGMPR